MNTAAKRKTLIYSWAMLFLSVIICIPVANGATQDSTKISDPAESIEYRTEFLKTTLNLPSEMVFNGQCTLVHAQASPVCEGNGWFFRQENFDESIHSTQSEIEISGKNLLLLGGLRGQRCVTTGLTGRQKAVELPHQLILNRNPHYLCNYTSRTYNIPVEFYRISDGH